MSQALIYLIRVWGLGFREYSDFGCRDHPGFGLEDQGLGIRIQALGLRDDLGLGFEDEGLEITFQEV